MAAYAATVTSQHDRPWDITPGGPLRMYAGRIDITNYNQTLVEVKGITGKFKKLMVVVAGTAEGGDWLEWVHASGAFKAYVSTTGAEVANDVDVGEADFIAIGV